MPPALAISALARACSSVPYVGTDEQTTFILLTVIIRSGQMGSIPFRSWIYRDEYHHRANGHQHP
jgi:hypothetical protein